MSNNTGLVWVDMTPDFAPLDYAEAFAEDDVVDALRESDSVEDQLLCLYENGYLAKREGRMQFILPEDADLEEMMGPKEQWKPWMKRKAGRAAGKAKAGAAWMGGKAKAGYGKAKSGAGYMGGKAKGAGKWAMANKGKAAGALAGTAAVALGARALYKKMKARKASKKNEGLNDADLEFLVNEAELLGLEIDSLDTLSETLDYGSLIDELLLDAEDDGLTETFSEEDIVMAALAEDDDDDEDEMDEATYGPKEQWKPWMKRKAAGAAGKAKAAGSYMGGKAKAGYGAAKSGLGSAGKWAKANKGKAAGATALAIGGALGARALYKRMKAKKAKKESMGENLNAYDLQRIITDSQELGFEIESYEDLLDTLELGEAIDGGFDYLLGEDALNEQLDEEVEVEVVEALLADIDEGMMDRLKSLGSKMKSAAHWTAGKAKSGGKAAWGGAKRGGSWAKANKKKAGAAALGTAALAGGAYALHKRRKKKKAKNESQGFSGYRSSASGGVFESTEGPIPYGTGNALYERIRGNLLASEEGQNFLEDL